MFDLEAQIKEWRAELARTGIAREVVDELEGHLREQIQRLRTSGCPESEAFQTAIRQLGNGKTLKTEFSKLKRRPLRIFRGHSLGLSVLAVWFVILGLNNLIWPLRHFCNLIQRILENYSFKDVGPIWPILFGWLVSPGIWFIIVGIGLLGRWRFCRVVALWFVTTLAWSTVYHLVFTGAPTSPLHAGAIVIYKFLGLSVPREFYQGLPYISLVIWLWGAFTLLRLLVGKLFRRSVVE